MGGLNALDVLGVRTPHDCGLTPNCTSDQANAINNALLNALVDGGGRVVMPANIGTVYVGSTLLIPSNVELEIPAGVTIKALAALGNAPVIQNADQSNGNTGCRIVGGGTIDGNRTAHAAGTWSTVKFAKVTGGAAEGVTIKSGYVNGLLLSGCSGVTVRATATDNGTHGMAMVDSTYCRVGGQYYDNCHVAASGSGDGINLSGTSTDNTLQGVVAYDPAGAGGTQGYGVREAAASGCDRNMISGCALAGNVTGTVSLVGGNSKYVDATAQAVTKIQEVLLAAPAATITFTNIPQTFRNLRLVLTGRSAKAATTDMLYLQFNGDTGANYDFQQLTGIGATAAGNEFFGANAIRMGYIPGANATADYAACAVVDIPNYANTTFQTVANSRVSQHYGTASGNMETYLIAGFWRSKAGITSITLSLTSTVNFAAGTIAMLYGEP